MTKAEDRADELARLERDQRRDMRRRFKVDRQRFAGERTLRMGGESLRDEGKVILGRDEWSRSTRQHNNALDVQVTAPTRFTDNDLEPFMQATPGPQRGGTRRPARPRLVADDRVREAIDSLTTDQQVAIHLLVFERMTERDAAEQLGIGRSTLRFRRDRALEAIRAMIDANG